MHLRMHLETRRALVGFGLRPVRTFVLLAVTSGMTAGLSGCGDDSPTASWSDGDDGIGAVCDQWRSSAGNDAPPAEWCDRMAAQMGDLRRTSSGSGSMMWGSADRMREECVRAMAESDDDDAVRWCDEMVTWMHDHLDTRDGTGGTMMHGSSMMNGG